MTATMTDPAAKKPVRYDSVDALRGFALFGLFVLHCLEYYELYWVDPQPNVWHEIAFFLFAGKSFALFALCFGLSFHIIMSRAAARGVDFTGRFAWRLTILLGLGLLHGLIYRGEILQVLALLGLTLIAFQRIRSHAVLLAIAAVFLAQPLMIGRVLAALAGQAWALEPPAFWSDPTIRTLATGSFADVLAINAGSGNAAKWSFYIDTGRVGQILGLFLTGLVLGRIGFFQEPGRYNRARLVGLAVSLALMAALAWAGPALRAAIPDGPNAEMSRAWLAMLTDGWSKLAFMAVQLFLFVELWHRGGALLLRAFAPAGRMTLTLYVGQSLVFVPVFYGFGLGLYDDIGQRQAFALGLIAFALQMIAARLWFTAFAFGPLEWAWRAATYRTLDVPFRKRRATVGA